MSNRLPAAIRLLKRAIGLVGGARADAIAARISADLVPIIEIATPAGPIRFFCAGALPEYRARTLLTKEPETIEWIDGFGHNAVLWDIGANVGIYSLYAGLKGGRVLAFEPSAGNYYLLNRNIEINSFDDRISAFCLAFSDASQLASFHMQNTELGGALNSFGDPVDWRGETFKAAFKQSMLGFSVDEFIARFDPPFPEHIKIDVDGLEDRIVAGARATLADSRLKSVHIELDSNREAHTQDVSGALEQAGLKFVRKAHAAEYDASAFSSSYNYLFVRNSA